MSSLPKQALILAAGRGSRMKGITDSAPKCAVELNSHPLLYWQVSSLRKAGIEKVAVVSGYRENYFKDLPFRIDTFFHNPEWSESNMVWSMLAAREFLRETTIVSYSDIVYDPEIIRKLSRSKADLSITCDTDWLSLWSRRFSDPLDDAETLKTDSDGILLEIGRKPQSVTEIESQYMGLLKFTPSIVRTIETSLTSSDLKNMHMTGLLDALIQKNIKINTVEISGGWCEIDSQKDLEVANEMFNNGEILQNL